MNKKNKIIFSRFDKDEGNNIKNDEEDIESNLFDKNINFSIKKEKNAKLVIFVLNIKHYFQIILWKNIILI